MSIAILYSGRYGTTKGVADRVAGAVDGDVPVTQIRRGIECPDADTIVIGAAIYGGKASGAVTGFVESHRDALMGRRVLLYVACLYDGERAEQQLADSFPPWLIAHSSGRYYVGGQVVWSRLSFFHKLLMKRVAGIEGNVERLRSTEIDRMIADLR
ncbi:MAG: hypothetical protein EA382_17915 [Spirochaetaceae bacterium]|nr:MAG: hypothetical protein EA382_17915 [Spirochaetaceae bacterium]